MCLEIACWVSANGAASCPTVASPADRRVRIARRVGSASAAKVELSSSAAAASSGHHRPESAPGPVEQLVRNLPARQQRQQIPASSRPARRPAPADQSRSVADTLMPPSGNPKSVCALGSGVDLTGNHVIGVSCQWPGDRVEDHRHRADRDVVRQANAAT